MCKKERERERGGGGEGRGREGEKNIVCKLHFMLFPLRSFC